MEIDDSLVFTRNVIILAATDTVAIVAWRVLFTNGVNGYSYLSYERLLSAEQSICLQYFGRNGRLITLFFEDFGIKMA